MTAIPQLYERMICPKCVLPTIPLCIIRSRDYWTYACENCRRVNQVRGKPPDPVPAWQPLTRVDRSMVQPSGCSRCGGDRYVEPDEYGVDWVCLQCGYREEKK